MPLLSAQMTGGCHHAWFFFFNSLETPIGDPAQYDPGQTLSPSVPCNTWGASFPECLSVQMVALFGFGFGFVRVGDHKGQGRQTQVQSLSICTTWLAQGSRPICDLRGGAGTHWLVLALSLSSAMLVTTCSC